MLFEGFPIFNWLSDTFEKSASDILVGKQKSRKIKKFVRQEKARASMMPLLPDVILKLSDEHCVDELIINCYRSRLENGQIASLFLYGNANTQIEDEFTSRFLEGLIRGIVEIASECFSDDVISAQVETRRSAAEIKGAISRSTSKDWELLSRKVADLEKGIIDLDTFENGFKNDPESHMREYVLAYSRACKGLPPKRMDIPSLPDHLSSSLASVLFAARLYDSCVDVLQRAESETADIQFAVEQVKSGSFDLGPLSEIGLSENSPFAPFALCLNAEQAYSAHCVMQSIRFYEMLEGSLNPLSLTHKRIIQMWNQLLIQRFEIARSELIAYFDDMPAWGNDALLEDFALPLGFALEECGLDALEEIQHDPKYELIRHRLEPSLMSAKLRRTDDCSQIVDICNLALEGNYLITYAEGCFRRISIDPSSKEDLFEDFSNNLGIVKENYVCFSFYTECLNENISYEEFLTLGSKYEEEPRFHLSTYEKFRNSEEQKAIVHIERAIELMRCSPKEPCLGYAHIWISYLAENNRSNEVSDILVRFCQNLPGYLCQPLLGAILNSSLDEEAEAFILKQLEGNTTKDPGVFTNLARYHFTKGNELDSLRCAMKSFMLKKNIDAAIIALQMHLVLNMDAPDDLIAYAKEADVAETNFLLSELAIKESSPEVADAYSIRAILQTGDPGGNALVRYMSRHVGGDEPGDPMSIRPQTYVVLKSKCLDRTVELLFHENQRILLSEGMEVLGARHFSTSSPYYVEMKSRAIGETVSFEDSEWVIEAIFQLEAFFCRRAFSYLVETGNGKVLTFDDSEEVSFIEQLTSQLKELDLDNPKRNLYTEGIRLNEDTILYLGIETGNKIFSKNQFGFTITAVKNPWFPFRRANDNFLEISECKNDYLLSYNAIVLLAMLDLLPDAKDRIAANSAITASTKNRLHEDIRQLLHDQDVSPGSLTLVDDSPVLIEPTKDELFEIRHYCAEALDIVNRLSILNPVDTIELPSHFGFFGTSTCQDISTAKRASKLFVTEDITQAQFIDLENDVERCSLYALFEGCGYGILAGGDLGMQFYNWNAQPPVDFHIALALRELFGDQDNSKDKDLC